MAANFKSEGKTLRYTAVAALSSGDPVQIGGLAGVALSDMGIGDTDEVRMEGVFEFDKVAATAMSQGDLVEWLNSGSEVVPDAAGDYDLGYVWKDAASADAKVQVRLLRP